MRVAALLALALANGGADAQSTRIPAASAGQTRVLVVFVRFADDQTPDAGCRGDRGWPSGESADRLPEYARGLLAPRPEPPFADSSLTEYFFRQSNRKFTLYGDVFPRVVVSKHGAANYSRSEGRGYGHLTAEVLAAIDPEVDFARYDTNPRDGVLDHVFLVVRRDHRASFTGVADLRGADRLRGWPDKQIVLDGVRVDWASSGSFVINHRPGHIVSQSYMVRMFAHEFGHHLWNPRGVFSNHVPAIRSNRTPANDSGTIGYTLMAGRGGGSDARGDLLISAPERDALEWIEPLVLSPRTAGVLPVLLRDMYSSGDAVRVDLHSTADGERTALYLTNRQRIGWFDRYRLDREEGCPSLEMGFLRTTGLLVMLTRWKHDRLTADVLAADGTLELSSRNVDYEGDLFGYREAFQITPFTEPSTALANGEPSWVAIDEIGPAHSGSVQLQFVFVPDFRERAVIRAESRITERMGRVIIRGDLRFDGPHRLTVESGAHLEVQGRILLSDRSSVAAAEGSRLTLNGTTYHVLSDTVIEELAMPEQSIRKSG